MTVSVELKDRPKILVVDDISANLTLVESELGQLREYMWNLPVSQASIMAHR